MANKKEKERKLACTLFVEAGLSAKEISEQINISEKTLSKWREADKWDNMLVARNSTRSQNVADMQDILSKLVTLKKDKQKNGEALMYEDIHAISELTNAITKLQAHQTLSSYIEIMTEFLNYLKENDLTTAKLVNDKVFTFIKLKAKQVS